jgi:two-component system chemotaxis sensor kinase CheA
VDLSRYTALFLADSKDHLRRSSTLLLEWEREPHQAEPVGELFRSFHSLKGAAATMGYDQVADVAHRAENLLEAVRRRELDGSPAVIGLLLRAVDHLDRAVDDAVAGRELADSAPLAEALERLAQSATPSTVSAAAAPPALAASSASTEHGGRTPRRSGAHPTPATTARIQAGQLDELVQRTGELVVARNRLLALAGKRADPDLEAVAGQVDTLVRTLHAGVVRARLAPIHDLFDRFPRVVRDLGAALGKSVRLELHGEGIELDRSVLEELVDPMIHLIRNAVDHGIEPAAERVALGKPAEGRLVLTALRRREWVILRLSDDGRGIDPSAVRSRAVELGVLGSADPLGEGQLLSVLARPGFTLKREVTAVSGRGIGMDAVLTKLRSLGGAVELISRAGQGTAFELSVPLTTAIQRVLLVSVGDERLAFPFRLVREAVLPGKAESPSTSSNAFTFRGRSLPLVDLGIALGVARSSDGGRRPILVLEWGTRDGALAVDQVLGQHDVLIERVEAPIGMPAWVSGATILADGSPAFVLDPTALF